MLENIADGIHSTELRLPDDFLSTWLCKSVILIDIKIPKVGYPNYGGKWGLELTFNGVYFPKAGHLAFA